MIKLSCPDCAVSPGKPHADGCDVERCSTCGRQRISCGCGRHSDARRLTRLPWLGVWPGLEDCRRLGWYVRIVEGEWQRCAAADEGAAEDLNRLVREARWSVERHRFEANGH